MESSILVARIAALTYLAAGVAAFSGRIVFERIVEDFERSQALTFITGFFTLVIGMLLVQYHNQWVSNWTVLVTIIGWLALFKGMMLIAFPQLISSFKGLYKNSKGLAILMIVLGIVFGYFGFIA